MEFYEDNSFKASSSIDLHSQATSFAKLAESESIKSLSFKGNLEKIKLDDELGLFAILHVLAESAGLLQNRKGNNLWTNIYSLSFLLLFVQ